MSVDTWTSNMFSSLQDALFFLKDYFSNLASYVNPYLPVDPASEGDNDISHSQLFLVKSTPGS